MNSGHYIKQCLRKICYQEFERDYKVFVGYEKSTDDTRKILEEYPLEIYEIEPGKFHHARTRNEMIDKANSDYIVLISDDVVPKEKDWLTKMWRIISRRNDVAGVFGKELPKEDSTPMEAFYKRYNYPDSSFMLTRENLDSISEHKNYFTLTNTIIRKDVWENHRFNMDILTGGPEKDWALKVVLNGYKIIYDPSFPVYHSHNYTIGTVFKRYFDMAVTREQSEYQKKYEVSLGGKFFYESVDYFLKELNYFREKGWLKTIPYAFIYDVSRFIGFNLGKTNQNIQEILQKFNSKLA